MSCIESLLADLEQLMDSAGQGLSDLVILCEEEEIRVNRVILEARSPVFRAMLQSDMVEKVNGVIKIKDASKGDVKQMVNYMYTAKIDQSYARYKELLVLANKYQVLELINLCSSKILESLCEENALEIGMFGEMHNSENLIDRCANYIGYNMTESTNPDWMERIAKSPKLMLEVIKILREVHENELCVIQRMEEGKYQLDRERRIDAIAFEVDAEVWLRGVGLYGNYANIKLKAHIKVFLNEDCHLEETKEYTREYAYSPVKIIFSSPVKIKPNRRYDIITSISGGWTNYGVNAKKVVQSSGKNPFNVTFFDSPLTLGSRLLDQDSTSTEGGQIPALYFRAPFRTDSLVRPGPEL